MNNQLVYEFVRANVTQIVSEFMYFRNTINEVDADFLPQMIAELRRINENNYMQVARRMEAPVDALKEKSGNNNE